MARVLIPVMPRRYNHNPVGSSTATVMMKANNPFEAPVRQVSRRSGSLPGMGSLDVTALQSSAQETLQASATSSGFNWAQVGTSLAQTGIDILGTAGQNIVNKLVPPPSTTLKAPSAILLPGQPGAGAPALQYAQPAPSKLPWILGGVAVLGGVLFFTMRKPGRK